MIKIGLAQVNFWVGDFEKNIKKIITFINKAKQNKLDLLIFPELSVVGYPPLDLLLNTQFINKNLQFLNLIIKETKNLSCLVGFVNKKDKDIYNACAFISNRKLVSVYHKVKLEENIFFNEKRYFKEGSSPYIYEFKNYKFSISLGKELKHLYSYFKKNRIDFIVNPSCFPFYLGEFDSRKIFLSSLAKKINSSILNCNLVGAQDELVFGGKSVLVSSLGELILYGKGFEEELLIFKFKPNKKYRAKKFLTDNMKDIFSAISLGLYDYVRKSGFKKVILGVSGGLDSALALTIATITLGKKNVKALIMPSRYTSMETFSDAKKICKKLGIEYFIIDIEEIFQTYLKILKPYFRYKKEDITEENIQARIRANLLMAFSNKFNYLVLNTGNRSEISTGYCTLYGDAIGGFSILKDLSKTMVYKLAYYINRKIKKIIPLTIIKRPPSAELKFGQKDTDTLPPYEVLDPIINFLDLGYSLDGIVKKRFSKKIVKKVINLIQKSEFKRRQMPLGIKIMPFSVNKGKILPVNNNFNPNL